MFSNTAVLMVLPFLWTSGSAQDHSVYDFDTSRLGKKFDGIGALSGGASSPLLTSYPEKQRSEILDYLFKPNFGASLQILKVEIGGDADSTDGAELSHMHNPWEESYQRGYEFWLMVEAKMRNPNIKLYGLPYSFPGWLRVNGSNTSIHPSATADYIARWINGAKTHYNLTIDFIGLWNERNVSVEYIKILRRTLDSRGFSHTQIVAADDYWDSTSILEDIVNFPEVAASVAYIGTHFPGTMSPLGARLIGKPLWSAADYSTFNDNDGGGCWARILNKNYAVGHMTATIAWSLVVSYYYPLPNYRQGLMTAMAPWSGSYSVDPPIWISAHTTQFTEVGWTYLEHGSGVGMLAGGGSYVAFLSPDGKDLTIIIETMSHDHSTCNQPPLPSFTVVPQNITLRLLGALASELTQLNRWYSKLGFNGGPTQLFENLDALPVQQGEARLLLGVDEVYTLTTLNTGQKGEHPPPPPITGFPSQYFDDFERYPLKDGFGEDVLTWETKAAARVGQQPFNLMTQTGAFEVVQSGDPGHGQVVRQMVLDMPVAWCAAETIGKALTISGDTYWIDLRVEVDASLGKVNGTDGVFLAARYQFGGCNTNIATGVFFFFYPRNQSFAVYRDAAARTMISQGKVPFPVSDGWNHLSLIVKLDTVTGEINGKTAFSMTAPVLNSGFVAFGTSSYGLAEFDNFAISVTGSERLRSDPQA